MYVVICKVSAVFYMLKEVNMNTGMRGFLLLLNDSCTFFSSEFHD
jgi:hypothetical protein